MMFPVFAQNLMAVDAQRLAGKSTYSTAPLTTELVRRQLLTLTIRSYPFIRRSISDPSRLTFRAIAPLEASSIIRQFANLGFWGVRVCVYLKQRSGKSPVLDQTQYKSTTSIPYARSISMRVT
eukprot:1185781-Prorocentrum_minimum.AAC.14